MIRIDARIFETLIAPARNLSMRHLVAVLLAWQDRAGQRRALRGLSDHQLRDLGLSRADVEREAGKPFWTL